MKILKDRSFLLKAGMLLWIVFYLAACQSSSEKEKNDRHHLTEDWPIYGGNKAGNRHSPLDQINLNNVNRLQIAWTYNSEPDITAGKQIHSEMECQPIVVNGILYATSPQLKLFALDAATGKRIWVFDPFKNTNPRITTCRGVVYWEDGQDKRILFSAGSNLYAIHAFTGLPVVEFGDQGKIDLHTGLNDNFDVSQLYVAATTPGIVYKNLLIIGSAVSEGGDAAPGYVRGFDILSGKLTWIFHTVPQPGEFGYDTWPKGAYKKIGATNNWSGITVDDKRGIVYLGTGSPAADFYGGARKGINLF
jgi:quinoprotein glucose dehydrogenase